MRLHALLRLATALTLAVVGIAAFPVDATPAATADELRIRVLSNRADLVSGGDALVRVDLPRGTHPSAVRVTLNDKDVTKSFAVRSDGAYEGVVTGLRRGANNLIARTTAGAA